TGVGPVRSAGAGAVRPTRTARLTDSWTVRSADPRPVWSASAGPIRSSRTWTVGSSATWTVGPPDTWRPSTWTLRRAPVRRRRMPRRRTDPDLVPPAVIPAPPVIPSRADENSGAEDQRAGQCVGEDHRGIVNRHVDPFGIGGRDIDSSGSTLVARCHDLLWRGFEIAGALSFRAQQLDHVSDVFGLR